MINKIKEYYKEYKNKIEILKLFGKILNKSDIDEDAKPLLLNYKTINSKCQALLDKILSGLARLSKEYLNMEEFVKIKIEVKANIVFGEYQDFASFNSDNILLIGKLENNLIFTAYLLLKFNDKKIHK